MKLPKYNPKSLPYIGALVQAGLFAVAGYKYFNVGPWGAVAGLGMGALVNLSLATASSRISDVAKARRPLAWVSLIGLFAISPAVIVSSLGWSWSNLFWSIGADLSIILTGAIIGKGLTTDDMKPGKPATQPETETPKPAAKPRKVAETVSRNPITDEELVAFFSGNPDATNADAARHFNVSHTAIGKRAKKLFGVKQ